MKKPTHPINLLDAEKILEAGADYVQTIHGENPPPKIRHDVDLMHFQTLIYREKINQLIEKSNTQTDVIVKLLEALQHKSITSNNEKIAIDDIIGDLTGRVSNYFEPEKADPNQGVFSFGAVPDNKPNEFGLYQCPYDIKRHCSEFGKCGVCETKKGKD